MIKPKSLKEGITIDLDGPEGNAFYLMGFTKRTLKTAGFDQVYIDDIINEMMSGDYDDLLKVFDRELGHLVILETSNEHFLNLLKNKG